MSSQAASDLTERIHREIDYCRIEYEMTYAEVVGVLTMSAHQMMEEAENDDEGDSDE